MSSQDQVRLDLNSPKFQQQLFGLGKNEQRSVLLTLRKLSKMTWDQVYRDAGLNWEAILSYRGPEGERLYSLRMGKAFRAVAMRKGNYLQPVALHPDHDAAYTN